MGGVSVGKVSQKWTFGKQGIEQRCSRELWTDKERKDHFYHWSGESGELSYGRCCLVWVLKYGQEFIRSIWLGKHSRWRGQCEVAGSGQQCSEWWELCAGLQSQPGDETGDGGGPLDRTEELDFTQEVLGRLWRILTTLMCSVVFLGRCPWQQMDSKFGEVEPGRPFRTLLSMRAWTKAVAGGIEKRDHKTVLSIPYHLVRNWTWKVRGKRVESYISYT